MKNKLFFGVGLLLTGFNVYCSDWPSIGGRFVEYIETAHYCLPVYLNGSGMSDEEAMNLFHQNMPSVPIGIRQVVITILNNQQIYVGFSPSGQREDRY